MYSRDNKDMKTSILKLPEMALPPIIQTGSLPPITITLRKFANSHMQLSKVKAR